VKRWVGALVLVGSAALAQDDAARAQIDQRIKLNAKLLSDSPTAQRIATSGNVQAQSHLEEGRVHQALAEDLFAKGDLAGARRAVDAALHHVSMARRMAPDQQGRQAAARQRYEQKQAELDRLMDAWRRHAGGTDATDGDLFAATGLIVTARQFAQESRFEDAGHTLAAAESHVLTGMNRLLRSKTLDYTMRPSTPAEEFQLELTRHKGLADLVPLALAELKPKADALALIDRYGKTSQSLRSEAQARFAAGDTPQALADVRNAILYLQRALSAAGVSAPDATGSPP
jgi:tetratricopeptide (TPR) repeat protein